MNGDYRIPINTAIAIATCCDTIDRAITVVSGGYGNYDSAIRSTIKEMAVKGLRVEYESGLHRRLDTAVRQNVLDGAREINRKVREQIGKEFGSDGVEITAHGNCAEDHIPYQGKQYKNKDFENLQLSLKRRVGEHNCKHATFPILYGISEPTHSEQQLQEFATYSSEKIEIGGVTKSRYEWTQYQRKLETDVRYQKDIANAAKASGDDVLRRQAQADINSITRNYEKISKAAGIPTKPERMSVIGFRRVKPLTELTTSKGNDIITITDEQFGKKIGKHAIDWGLNASNSNDRDKLRKIINNIANNSDEKVYAQNWRGYDEVVYNILGDDVVITKPDNTFITIMKGGVNNARVKNAREQKF